MPLRPDLHHDPRPVRRASPNQLQFLPILLAAPAPFLDYFQYSTMYSFWLRFISC